MESMYDEISSLKHTNPNTYEGTNPFRKTIVLHCINLGRQVGGACHPRLQLNKVNIGPRVCAGIWTIYSIHSGL